MLDRSAAFRLLPITFRGLVVENTNVCNAKCAMCYQSSGPRGSDRWGQAGLRNDVIKQVIEHASGLETMQKRFHLAGGESFVRADECFELFEHAAAHGYSVITTTTNGFWGASPVGATRVARSLRRSGVTGVELSWDFWHLPYVRPTAVSNAILACSEQGVYLNLRVLTTKTHDLSEALALLDVSAIDAVDEISVGPVMRIGRAVYELADDEFHAGTPLGSNCHSILHLTVNSQGNVYPCCAGADQTDSLSFGNVHRESILDIYQRMNESRLLRLLVFYGVGAFVPILQQKGIQISPEPVGMCELCWEIFSDQERAQMIWNHFERIDQASQSRLLAAVATP